MFGNIVKVTPSSKVVGDMALFMTSNGLSKEDVLTNGTELSYPDSVINFFKGDLGQPEGGFPKELQKQILKGETPIKGRPNVHLEPVDFEKGFKDFKRKFDKDSSFTDFISQQFYPKVYEDFFKHREQFGEVSYVPSKAFFYGLDINEEIIVEIVQGKRLIVRLQYVTEPDEDGIRQVFFKLNGQTRVIDVKDHSFQTTKIAHRKVETENEIGAPLQGKLSKVLVKNGEEVEKNTPLFIIEAMKMESTVTAPFSGKVQKIHLRGGVIVEQDDLIVELKSDS